MHMDTSWPTPSCLSDWEEERAGGTIDARHIAERMAAAEAVAEV